MKFKSGQTGNPNGRPPARTELVKKLLAKKLDLKAIEVLEDEMKNGKDKVAAAKFLLEMCYGKAPQAVEMSNDETGTIKVTIV